MKYINRKSVGILFICVLIVLIFFSKTIYQFNLPLVTGIMPINGKLNKHELTTGVSDYASMSYIYSDVSGKVSDVFVKEGDAIKAGDPIISMDYNGADTEVQNQLSKAESEIENRKLDMENSIKKASMDITELQNKIKEAEREIKDLQNETNKMDNVSSFPVVQAEADYKKAEEDYAKNKILFESGAVSGLELQNAQFQMESAKQKLEEAQKTYNESIEKVNKSFQDKQSEQAKQLETFKSQLITYQNSLKSKQLDIVNYNNQLTALQESLLFQKQEYENKLQQYNNNKTIYAKNDAIIDTLSVSKGQFLAQNQPIVKMGDQKGIIVNTSISLDNNFVKVGDNCKLSNASNTLQGIVTSVKPTEKDKTVIISIDDPAVQAGESFDILFEKQSADSFVLVPNGALNKDSEGYYLYQIKRREGIMGEEFYLEKLRIYIGDSDSENTVVIKGIGFFEPVVLLSDKTISDKSVIKLKNESDFFEK